MGASESIIRAATNFRATKRAALRRVDEAGPRNDLSLSDSTSFLLKRKHPQSRTHCDADLLFSMVQYWATVAIYHKTRELTVASMLQKKHSLVPERSQSASYRCVYAGPQTSNVAIAQAVHLTHSRGPV